MQIKPILIIAGEPNSVFLEIFFKCLKKEKYKSPLILICSQKLLRSQMNYFKFKKKIKSLDPSKLKYIKLDNNSINLIDVEYKFKKVFNKVSKKSKKYIEELFSIGCKIIKSNYTNKLINGPISKKHFLNKKFLGITEYLSTEFNAINTGMLIYNKNLSVSPLTTHLPIKKISNSISKNLIIKKIKLINSFYKKNFSTKPKIGLLGLNPHCETSGNFSEEEIFIKPALKVLKNLKIKVSGPLSADTAFLRQNRKKYDVIVGMYHDQVLTPLKTLYEYDAINITMGLPFLRVSPDHGPNEKMVNKNLSNPTSLHKALQFLDKNWLKQKKV